MDIEIIGDPNLTPEQLAEIAVIAEHERKARRAWAFPDLLSRIA